MPRRVAYSSPPVLYEPLGVPSNDDRCYLAANSEHTAGGSAWTLSSHVRMMLPPLLYQLVACTPGMEVLNQACR